MILAPAVAAAGFMLSSSAFPNGGTLPARYTCDGKGVSPPLRWTAPPPGTRSLKLLVVDPDAPSGLFVHWRATRISPSSRDLREGQHAVHEGFNGFGKRGSGAPCPPPGPAHRYFFILSALNAYGRKIAEADLVAHFGRR